MKKSSPKNNETSSWAVNIEKYQLMKLEQSKLYSQASSEADCSLITGDETLKKNCYAKVYMLNAVKQKDPSLCEKIEDATRQSTCKNGTIYTQNDSSNTLWTCDKIINDPVLQYTCQKEVVFRTLDTSNTGTLTLDLCSILHEEEKAYCQKRITLTVESKNTNTAIAQGDATLCASITDEALKKNCIDGANYQKAVQGNGINTCDAITDPTRKQDCLESVIKIGDQKALVTAAGGSDVNACSKIADPATRSTCEDRINYQKALDTKSVQTCDLLEYLV